MTWQLALALTGAAQLGLAAGSLAIPGVLGWREETGRLSPLTRSVFWTYAAYIWCTHLLFAALCLLAPELLVEKTRLSVLVNGFIAGWWGARLLIQFAAFDRCRPPVRTWLMVIGEEALVAVFLACTAVHGALFLRGVLG